MKDVIVIYAIIATSAAKLVSLDEVEDLFKKFVLNELTREENKTLQDVIEVLRKPDYVSHRRHGNSYRQILDCWLCRSAFVALFEGVERGLKHDHLAQSITFLCVHLNLGNTDVCKGAVKLNVPILSYIVKTTKEATPRTFCGLVLQDKSGPNACVVEDPRFNWRVDLPEPTTVKTKPPIKDVPVTVALISDAHLDPLYKPYGAADCDQPVCCRKGQTSSQAFKFRTSTNNNEPIYEHTIVNTDDEVLLDLSVAQNMREMRELSQRRSASRNSGMAGYWGDYRNCDTPIWAFDDVVDRIADTHKVDIVYYMGDTVGHFVWETTPDLVKDMDRYLVNKLRKSFGDDVLVVPVIGNHDSHPTNMFAPAYVKGKRLNTTWLYKALADNWDFYLPDEARASMLERGEYSVLAKPGLRVITLNNNVSFRYNWWLVYDPLDAKKHLDWLVEELHKAELAGERVHIVTHIPPGVPDLTLTWTREYNRIINRFASTIAGEFNGHSHADEFKIFYSPDGTPVRVAWAAGSATAYENNNLNYKIVTLDAATYEPINIVNYVYNLTEANLTPNKRPHWFQLYDLRQRFNLPDLSPASMDNLVTRMVTTDPQLLDLYAAFFTKQSDTHGRQCDIDCKMDCLCRTVTTVLWHQQKCDELKNLYLLSTLTSLIHKVI